MQIDWNELHFFLVIAEEGSLSAAARKLRVSQPTLSRRLVRLEESLGCDLFARAGGTMVLTARGVQLVERIKSMRDEVFAIERTVIGDDDTALPEVVVSVPGSLTGDWVAGHLPGLLAQHPDIVVDMHAEWVAADLLRREADIAVRLFRPTQQDLRIRKVARVVTGLYASPAYLKHHGMPHTAADLADHDFILPSLRLLPDEVHKTQVGTQPRGARVVFRADSFSTLQAAALRGVGIAPLPCYSADPTSDLVRVVPDLAVFEQDLYLVAHAELARNSRIRAVFDYFAGLFAADAALFDGSRAHAGVAGKLDAWALAT